jgi:hypothetical protein
VRSVRERLRKRKRESVCVRKRKRECERVSVLGRVCYSLEERKREMGGGREGYRARARAIG